MCGRFTLATPPEILAGLFGVDTADWNDPRFNIAPQVRIVTIRSRQGKRIGPSLLWGAPNPRDSRPLINARSETVATSPLFGPAFASSRLLVPADGFFEWTKEGARRQGRYFQRPGGGPFAFAGIAVNPPAASELGACAAERNGLLSTGRRLRPRGEKGLDEPAAVILTTQASESVKAYHDRMPVMVRPESFDAWLDERTNPKAVAALVAEALGTAWTSYPVGPAVNNVRNDSPDNLRLAEPAPVRQGSLF